MKIRRALSLFATAISLSVATVGCARKSVSHTKVQVSSPTASASFTQTQIAVIGGEKTLGRVITALDLEKQWSLSREQCIERIRKGLRIETIKGTDLLEIRISDTDPAMAKDIANSVAKNYRELTLQSGGDTKITIHEMAQ